MQVNCDGPKLILIPQSEDEAKYLEMFYAVADQADSFGLFMQFPEPEVAMLNLLAGPSVLVGAAMSTLAQSRQALGDDVAQKITPGYSQVIAVPRDPKSN